MQLVIDNFPVLQHMSNGTHWTNCFLHFNNILIRCCIDWIKVFSSSFNSTLGGTDNDFLHHEITVASNTYNYVLTWIYSDLNKYNSSLELPRKREWLWGFESTCSNSLIVMNMDWMGHPMRWIHIMRPREPKPRVRCTPLYVSFICDILQIITRTCTCKGSTFFHTREIF